MKKTFHSHKDLDIWKKSIVLVKGIYKLTALFPAEEKYGIVQQMRRSAISVPSNIAEGAGRFSKKEFIHFLAYAQGSLSEIETQIIISRELGFISVSDEIENQIGEIRSMIVGLVRWLERGSLEKE